MYVYTTHSSTTGLPSTTADLTLSAPSGASYFGGALDTGDVNGDGYADLVVGAPFEDAPGANTLLIGIAPPGGKIPENSYGSAFSNKIAVKCP